LTILIPQNEPVDVALDRTGTVGQGESGGDRGQVLADPGGEGVQLGLVIAVDPLEPAGQFLFSGALGHHLGEAGHVPAEAVELGAVAAHVGEQLLLAGGEVLGPAQEPAGDLADLQR
jgi:hypothetical protein